MLLCISIIARSAAEKSKIGMAMKQVRNGLKVNRMTLLEFTNKLFAVGDNTTVYVCDEEPDGYGEETL